MSTPPPPSPAAVYGVDAYAPREIAERVETVGVTKARLPLLTSLTLGVLAGGFIGLGALYFTLVTSDARLGFAGGRVLGGLVFSLGLLLVVVAGAELFTGNNLLAMAWAARRISTVEFARNLVIIYVANFAGALGLVLLVLLSRHWELNGGGIGRNAVAVAAAKTSLSFTEAFFRGVLCNVLVCLAVWLAMGGRTLVDKFAAILLPISAFVAAGFEHSVANMYLIPLGILLKDEAVAEGVAGVDGLTWAGLAGNLLPVTLGNLLGGSVLVALVYFLCYRRPGLR